MNYELPIVIRIEITEEGITAFTNASTTTEKEKEAPTKIQPKNGTTADVAKASGSSKNRVRYLAKEGRIPAEKDEDGWWVFPDVDGAAKYIKRHQHKNPRATRQAPAAASHTPTMGMVRELIEKGGRDINTIRKLINDGTIEAYKDTNGCFIFPDIERAAQRVRECNIKQKKTTKRTNRGTTTIIPTRAGGTVNDLAAATGVAPWKIRTLAKAGCITSCKNSAGRIYFSDMKSAIAYLNSGAYKTCGHA